MKTIQPTLTQSDRFDAKSAVSEMQSKQVKGKVIGYLTLSTTALLVCLSKGGPRDRKSVRPNVPLWGFIYLEEPLREAKFVRNSAVESVEMAIGNGSKVALWDSLVELMGNGDKGNPYFEAASLTQSFIGWCLHNAKYQGDVVLCEEHAGADRNEWYPTDKSVTEIYERFLANRTPTPSTSTAHIVHLLFTHPACNIVRLAIRAVECGADGDPVSLAKEDHAKEYPDQLIVSASIAASL